MKHKMLVGVCSMCLILSVLEAHGAEKPTGLAIGPRVGYYKPKDADQGEFKYGAQARMTLTEALSVEGSIEYRKETYKNEEVEVISYPVMASLILFPFPLAPISPYLIGGAIWDKYKATDEAGNEEKSSKFGYFGGFGAEMPLGQKMSINGDIRYVLLDRDLSLETLTSDNLKEDFWTITGGINFFFF
ncbi:MAG: porin family protein [bacterium]|nr:porin family protein [bacterium]